jgi:hypothetical protein
MGGKRTTEPFLRAYRIQKSNAKTRRIEFRLTFDEWEQIWIASGKWDQRGRGADKYCMCRVGDQGCYEVGNVFIGLGRINVREGNLGKPDSDETKRKKSEAAKGKSKPWFAGEKNPMHRPEVKAKMSAAIGGANHYRQRGIICPDGYFATAKDAAKTLGIPKPTVEWRARNNKSGFAYAK